MSTDLWLKAFVAGGIAAMPLGPMGALCLQQTMLQGRRAGLLAACGLALALGLWTSLIAHGLEAVSAWKVGRETYLRIGLGSLLIAIGLHQLRKGPRQLPDLMPSPWPLKGFLTTFLGVGSNPTTLTTLVGTFAVLNLAPSPWNPPQAAALALAVVLGAMALWFGLTAALIRLHRRWGERTVHRLSRGVNAMMVGAGISYLALALERGFFLP